MTATRWLISAALGGGVGWLAYRRRALTADGALAAACVGGVVFARGGVPAAAALLAFFGSSTWLSHLGERRKQSLPLAQAKGARRDAWQVLANGGVATLSIALGRCDAFLGALAAAGADTWATELGMLAGPPRLITSLRSVPAGTSGGVTLEGFAASLGGALAVGLTYGLLDRDRRTVLVASVSGVCASLADSVLGATLQEAYWCPRCDLPTEEPVHRRCGAPTELKHGYRWMTNDTVNALATAVGAGIAVLLSASWAPTARAKQPPSKSCSDWCGRLQSMRAFSDFPRPIPKRVGSSVICPRTSASRMADRHRAAGVAR